MVEEILTRAGYQLVPVNDAHLCCGSAGTYSLLQRQLATDVRREKLRNLTAGQPQVIATSNVGCQTYLGGGTELPVMHWIELLR